MLIKLRIDAKLYNRIADAVRSGEYASPQHFFEVAGWNQLVLEESTDGDAAISAGDDSKDGGRQESGGRGRRDRASAEELSSTGKAMRVSENGWRPMVRRVELRSETFSEPELMIDANVALWGQINRILPIAAGVRVLAHLSADRESGVPVSEWHAEATRVATELRVQLAEWDGLTRRPHGMKWATAFPQDEPASAHRYVSQFL